MENGVVEKSKNRKRSRVPSDEGWSWMILLGGVISNIIISGIPSNLISKYIGTRLVVIIGGCLASLGFLLSRHASNIYYLYITYGLLIGIGSGLAYSPGIVIVGTYFDKKRALANGIAYAGSGLGSIVIPPLLSLLLKIYDLDGSFLIMSALTLNVCIAGTLFRSHSFYASRCTGRTVRTDLQPTSDLAKREENENEALMEMKHDNVVSVLVEFDSPEKVTWCNTLFDLRLTAYSISAAISDACYSAVFMAATPYSQQMMVNSENDTDTTVWLLSAMGCADLLSRLGVALVADRNLVKKTTIYNVSIGLSSLSAAFIPSCTSHASLMVMCCIYASVGGAFISLIPTILADNFGIERLPKTWALTACYVGVAQLCVPTVAGLVKDISGTWHASFYMCSALVFTALCLNVAVSLFHMKKKK